MTIAPSSSGLFSTRIRYATSFSERSSIPRALMPSSKPIGDSSSDDLSLDLSLECALGENGANRGDLLLDDRLGDPHEDLLCHVDHFILIDLFFITHGDQAASIWRLFLLLRLVCAWSYQALRPNFLSWTLFELVRIISVVFIVITTWFDFFFFGLFDYLFDSVIRAI
eukprot:CAMPEP_0185598242 /NCGR_PEP_ID=MMETSP0434-20130131/81876_1 /TAXON_ID=626734 ORGANISM="Favella taraikaensis, Strain Fe Narragansett Bay" /NCGR_SAMPLE_ID=MMETSP0434 /ASSEMBLY_ACC=CAM_ASM_000379 /LENGTH=167 /DNA_ID=CAMNT_0028227179 /DNA_START=870 /DNA_END=1372 /DNA_ORIENTATION=+